jgi:MinD-like ATPase involved in chromosome partitioning or flagellar assembly
MGILGLASLHGAPGVTSLAAAVATRLHGAGHDTILIEADPDGGVLAARHRLPLAPNLVELAGVTRRQAALEDVRRHTQYLGGTVPVVITHPSAERTVSALRTCAEPLAPVLAGSQIRIVLDAGRWRPATPVAPLLERAARLLLVVRPTLDQVVNVMHAVDGFLDRERVRLVVVGEEPYSAKQVEEVTGVKLAATLPEEIGSTLANTPTSKRRRQAPWVDAVDLLLEHLGTW